MIKLENYEVMGFEHAIRGMRNPMNSWDRSDSIFGFDALFKTEDGNDKIGPNDHKLMMDLAKGGSVHAKYRRMIVVYVDITAPLYWWKEFDTYKVGTVANSCSTMHKIHDKKFTLEDFSCEHLEGMFKNHFEETIKILNCARNVYLNHNKEYKEDWWQMIQLLPSSYNQKRTVMLDYEVLVGIYRWRKDHKLDEWRELCKWIETLPYSEVITGKLEGDDEEGDGWI